MTPSKGTRRRGAPIPCAPREPWGLGGRPALRRPGLAGCALLLCLAARGQPAATATGGGTWPQFRGPAAAGLGADSGLPDKWSATENVAWKTDLPGRSWSSPIVWGDRVFLTAVVNLGESEAPKKGLYLGGDRPQPSKAEHEWRVFCLDLETGAVAWERTVHRGVPQTPVHLKSTYGAETPVADGERVYALFGNLGVLYDRGSVSCFEAKTGRVLYERAKLEGSNAFTSSPWAAGGRVFCLSEDGVCYVLRAGDVFEVLHTNALDADDMYMATPALAGGRLLIRSAARLHCIRESD